MHLFVLQWFDLWNTTRYLFRTSIIPTLLSDLSLRLRLACLAVRPFARTVGAALCSSGRDVGVGGNLNPSVSHRPGYSYSEQR